MVTNLPASPVHCGHTILKNSKKSFSITLFICASKYFGQISSSVVTCGNSTVLNYSLDYHIWGLMQEQVCRDVVKLGLEVAAGWDWISTKAGTRLKHLFSCKICTSSKYSMQQQTCRHLYVVKNFVQKNSHISEKLRFFFPVGALRWVELVEFNVPLDT